jgi:hypothetical protein
MGTTQSKSDRMPKKGRTYEEKPDSQHKVAAELGMSQSQISDTQRHVEAVKRYPELGDPAVSQTEALCLYRAWDEMNSQNRSRARRAWKAQQQAKSATAGAKKPPKPKGTKAPGSKPRQPPEVAAHVRLTRTWYVFTAGLMQVINDFEHSSGTAPLLAFWTPEERARAQVQLQERAAQLARVLRELEEGTAKGTQSGHLRVIHPEVTSVP